MRIQTGMVRCCLNLDQPFSALQIAQGVMASKLVTLPFKRFVSSVFLRTWNTKKKSRNFLTGKVGYAKAISVLLTYYRPKVG